MTAILLLLVGFLMVFLEFYLPGGIMGSIGAILIISSIVMYALAADSPLNAMLFILFAVIGTIIIVRLALWAVRRTKTTGSIFLQSDQEGYRAERYQEELVGKEGIAQCDLKPGGYVIIDDKKYAAISVAGFIKKNQPIEVTAVEGETLRVVTKE